MISFISVFLGLIGCGSKTSKEYVPAEIYLDLRQRVLKLNPSEIGIDLSKSNEVYAVLMETGHKEAIVTLVTVADGSVSLYFSNGGGIIGIGEHEEPRKACLDFLSFAPKFLKYASPTDSFPLPARGETRFYFLTFDGIYTVISKEKDLRNNRSLLSPFFHKAHEVITQARIVDEKRIYDAKQIISAAAGGNTQEIKRLLASGVSVDSADETGLTSLMAAAYSGQEESLRVLFDAKPAIDDENSSGYTALIFASNAGKASCVKLLIERGADVNAKDKEGSTPVMFAAQHGYNDVVRILLEHGADASVKGNHGLSAIGFAQQNRHKETEELLRMSK